MGSARNALARIACAGFLCQRLLPRSLGYIFPVEAEEGSDMVSLHKIGCCGRHHNVKSLPLDLLQKMMQGVANTLWAGIAGT